MCCSQHSGMYFRVHIHPVYPNGGINIRSVYLPGPCLALTVQSSRIFCRDEYGSLLLCSLLPVDKMPSSRAFGVLPSVMSLWVSGRCCVIFFFSFDSLAFWLWGMGQLTEAYSKL